MNSAIHEKIKDIFMQNKGYAMTNEISGHGINRFYLSELEKDGIITRIKAGLYKWNEYDFDNNFELVEVFRIVPQGVLCLKSALAYHELTTYNPWQYEVAIERNSKVIIPEYPPIKLVYFSRELYELGAVEEYIDGCKVSIYDIEKTVCDCIRYRNKIGIEMVKESLHEYLKRKDRNLNKLINYAEKCRIQKLVREYLEVLV